MVIWVLADDRAGNRAQALGVAEALDAPFVVKDIAYNALAKLPNPILGRSVAAVRDKSALTAPWPDLVIGAGRRTAPIARWIKHQAKRGGKPCHLVQIMDPGPGGRDDFDLIALPDHDGITLPNGFAILGAPHRVNEAKLAEGAASFPHLMQAAKPVLGLIVGGATKDRPFTTDHARLLGETIGKAASNASLLVTTSRRTGTAQEKILREILGPVHLFHGFGGAGANPYFGILAAADILVVTGDSVSMVSEACATGKSVYVFAPDGFVGPKHQRFLDALYAKNYAQPLGDHLQLRQPPILNAASDIAAEIRKRGWC